MTKPVYLVQVARKGRERDFRDFWENGSCRNDAGEALSAGRVGFAAPVRASNRREAMMLVRVRYPDHLVGAHVAKVPLDSGRSARDAQAFRWRRRDGG